MDRELNQINVIPLVDVMLVLLVIFMVTAPLLNLGVDIDLPQSSYVYDRTGLYAQPMPCVLGREAAGVVDVGARRDHAVERRTDQRVIDGDP